MKMITVIIKRKREHIKHLKNSYYKLYEVIELDNIDELLEITTYMNDSADVVAEWIEELISFNYTFIGDYKVCLVWGNIGKSKKQLKEDLKRYKRFNDEWETV
jgi:hypothetical protein